MLTDGQADRQTDKTDRQTDRVTGELHHEADGVRRRGHLRRACVLDREDGQRRAGN